MQNNKSTKYFKIVIGLLFAWYFLSSALYPDGWHFIDYVDLVIHEAGHWIFLFFGQFVSVIGGSLLQILIPIIFVMYFFVKKDRYSASLLITWVGYNFVNVSVYMADSIKMSLPLLGGDSTIHDWNYIFSSLNVLSKTNAIASVIYAFGIFVIIGGAIFAIRASFQIEDI